MLGGFGIRLNDRGPPSRRVVLYYSIDEKLLEEIKMLHISPSSLIKAALRREVKKRAKEKKKADKRLVINKFSGEVVGQS